MKVFISGQVGDKAVIRRAYAALRAAGHTITHDWTIDDPIAVTLENRTEAGRRAAKDLTGVVGCDVYILFSDNEKPGKGMYAELGAALALNETSGTPKLYIVGKLNHLSVFYLHPAIYHRGTIEEVITEITVAS
ncbi:MAG: hypothetical protein JWN01_83 [Patescibacteria group bacterium]|nr:hypothetical protein [Patescibacteria group bacterium]